MGITGGRKLNRMREYDYSQNNYYFVTICTKNWKYWLGRVGNYKMFINQFGIIVKQQWLWLIEQYPYVFLDTWMIMPNHIHGIIIIDSTLEYSKHGFKDNSRLVATGLDLSSQKNQKILSLSNIIGAFKTTSSKLIHQAGLTNFAWQRSFYDHVIRNEKYLDKIRLYIQNNPTKWEEDRNNPKNLDTL